MAKSNSKIPINDIWLASYQKLKNNPPELTLQGTRVVFEFTASPEFYKIAAEYNSNPAVALLDYISVVRRLRAEMLNLKEGQMLTMREQR
jgi:hypothetical protein